MAANSIDYLELYTSDKKSITDYFVSAFGFHETAHTRDDIADSTLLRQGDICLVVTAGPVTEEFLEEYGDGIADIAFVCADVEATRDAALAAGALPVGTVPGHVAVSGFGGVRHTLLPDSLSEPAGRSWTSAPALPSGGRILGLDHIAVCLEAGDLTDVAAFYLDGFGLERYSSEYIEIGGQAMDSIVVRSPSGAVTFTLLEPDATKDAGQLNAFLARNNGAGVQHLAFLVDDIVPAVHDFRERGVEFLSTPAAYYDLLIERLGTMSLEIADLREAHVLADRDEWGYLLQLFSRSPHPRNTLFYELIQRRGARGFGSANIKALYEAVERDRIVTE
jgi:4-hydroxymandelate synthase